MNFFDQQDRARRRSRWLIAVFLLAVVCIVVAVDLVVLLVAANVGAEEQMVVPGPDWVANHLDIVTWTSLLVIAAIVGATLFK
ncbi:MAG: peptidase M48, partial [Xanthomonadales bacterium]|nr:peptidase M48 [Xanthomonadales bacterium]